MQWIDPGTKATGQYIPIQCPHLIFIIPVVLVEKKNTLHNISHAMVKSIITSALSKACNLIL